jgi:hypothetical protein
MGRVGRLFWRFLSGTRAAVYALNEAEGRLAGKAHQLDGGQGQGLLVFTVLVVSFIMVIVILFQLEGRLGLLNDDHAVSVMLGGGGDIIGNIILL